MSIRLLLPLALLVGACAQTPAESSPAVSMEEFMALNVVGAEHEWMAPLVGTFHGTMSLFAEPGAEPMQSEGVMVNRWFLGGRWLRQDWSSDFMGQPLQGFGLFGYDTLQKRYQGFWVDTMGTFMAPITNGQAVDARTVETYGESWDPSSGHVVQRRDVVRIIDRNHHTFDMYQTHPGQDEIQILHVEYSRMADDGSLQDGELTDAMREQLLQLGYLGGDG